MRPRRIVFWEPSVSPHKLPLFRALLARGVDGTYVAEQALPPARAALGWSLGSLDGLDVRIAPSDAEIARLVAHAPRETLHLFAGIRRVPTIVAGLRAVLRSDASLAIHSEPRIADDWLGPVRLAQSLLTEGRLRRRAFVLAIGGNGPVWFRRAGYPAGRVFPFAYYLDALPALPRSDAVPTVGFLGRLTTPKGLPVFLDAVDRLAPGVQVLVAGDGPEADRLVRHPRVQYRGRLAMAEVPAFLSELDVLVQPSITKDGWGAVVSEALLAGTAAVATGHVGASILLDHGLLGATAAHPTGAAVAQAIERVLVAGTDEPRRRARAAWARGALTGEAGAERLLAIVDHLAGRGPAPPFPPPIDA